MSLIYFNGLVKGLSFPETQTVSLFEGHLTILNFLYYDVKKNISHPLFIISPE